MAKKLGPSLLAAMVAFGAAGLLSGCVVRGRGAYVAEVYAAPPVAPVVVVAPRPGYVWIDGRYAWDGYAWGWNDGYWVADRPGYVYMQGYWANRGHRHVWVTGGWRARGAAVQTHGGGRGTVVVRDSGKTVKVRSRPAPAARPGRVRVHHR